MDADLFNGMFEFVGAMFAWMNVAQLRRDQCVRGVYWPAWFFFSAWGLWNLFYYSNLAQWFSFAGGIALVSGNIAWCCAYWRCSWNRRR